MKALKVTFVFLFLGAVFLFPVKSSMAESETPYQNPVIQVNPHAPGTRVPGTLTIYYSVVRDRKNNLISCTTDDGLGSFLTNMSFFIRLQMGKEIHGFSGEANGICYGSFGPQIATIKNFIKEKAIPYWFTPTAVEVRSYNNFVQDDQVYLPYSPLFTIMDIELAAQ